jgi:hypothetical protein
VTVTPEAAEQHTSPRDEQREWENRWGKRAGVAAWISGLLIIGGFIYAAAFTHNVHSSNTAKQLLQVPRHPSDTVIPAILGAGGLLLLPIVLGFLYKAARYRHPDTPVFALYFSVVGPLLLAFASVAYQISLTKTAHHFADLPLAQQTKKEADHLLKIGSYPIYGILVPITALSMAVGFVLVNLNSMRAGLVTRFLGITGMIAGVLSVFFGGPTQILTLFWLGAIGTVLLNRWPGGRGPAWDALEELSWPSRMEERMAAASAQREAAASAGSAANGAAEPPDEPSTRAQRRKRKKRR